jgi:hypothetical protein
MLFNGTRQKNEGGRLKCFFLMTAQHIEATVKAVSFRKATLQMAYTASIGVYKGGSAGQHTGIIRDK